MANKKTCNSIEKFIKYRKNPNIRFKDIKFTDDFDFDALFRYAKESNNPNLLADCYLYGLGVKKSRRKARGYLLSNVSKDNAHIIFECAKLMFKQYDYPYEAARLFTLVSLFGIDSYEEIGLCYYRPGFDLDYDAPDSDLEDAIYWFTRGAENDNIRCMEYLIEIYSKVIYDCYDLNMAEKWRRRIEFLKSLDDEDESD